MFSESDHTKILKNFAYSSSQDVFQFEVYMFPKAFFIILHPS